MLRQITRTHAAHVWTEVVLLACMAFLALGVHAFLASYREMMPAGDTFNFINASHALRHAKYPVDEKRPPFYSFLIFVSKPFITDDIDRATAISVLGGVGGIVTLYAIGRHLKLPHFALLPFLTTAVFDPYLTLYGIRPLSQGIFFGLLGLSVLLVMRAKEATGSLVFLGFVLTALALTRLEGIPIAILLWVYLFFRLDWKRVLVVALSSLILLLPWLVVVTRTTGSPLKFPGSGAYLEETTSGKRGTSDPLKVMNGVVTIVSDTWALPWKIPVLLLDTNEREGDPYLVSLFTHAGWLVGMLGIIGFFWLLVTHPKRMIPVVLAFGLVVLIAAWYRPSLKYASPFLATWYLCAASGAMTIGYILAKLLKSKIVGTAATALIGVYTAFLILTPYAIHAAGLVTENFGDRYATMQAIKYVAKKEGVVLVPDYHYMARVYLGEVEGAAWEQRNAIYLHDFEEGRSLVEQRSYMIERNVRYVIDSGSERSKALLGYLSGRGELRLNKNFQSFTPKKEAAEMVSIVAFTPIADTK